jgi:hypothetical protein
VAGSRHFSGQAGEGVADAARYAEGAAAADIDGDGKVDLMAAIIGSNISMEPSSRL